MVQESVLEQIQLKRDLYDTIDEALDPDAVLATTTSYYRPSMFQPDMKTPERLVVGHPFCPPHLLPLVEVVGGEQTPVETVDWTCAFYKAIGKKVVRLKKEIAGFVSNRLQSAIFREYASLIEEGIVSVEDADTAVAYGPGLRWAFMGPTMCSHVSSPRGIEDAMSKYEVPPEILQERDGQEKWSPELSAAVVKAAATMSRNRPVDELWRQRDETLVSILEVLKKHDW
jgi:3-hydroxyacyl-CoA dehydrogenase